jgi:hypothetical protein
MAKNPTSPQDDKISFLGLAEAVLNEKKQAMSASEIWRAAKEVGLDKRLDSVGKTPDSSLASMLYVDVKKESSRFSPIGSRPVRFLLRSQQQAMTPEQLKEAETAAVASSPDSKGPGFKEIDLHPLLVWFADYKFDAKSKTIDHNKSEKTGSKHNQWIHPDVVAFALPAQNWNADVFKLSRTSRAQTLKLFSFELKRELSFSYLREYFFQAVSNSSWAHEGYLVAVEIDPAPEFRDELRRLSQSFGIGVIQIDVESAIDSEIIFPATPRVDLDWEAIDRVARINPDFALFVLRAVQSDQINMAAIQDLDRIMTNDDLNTYLAKKFS